MKNLLLATCLCLSGYQTHLHTTECYDVVILGGGCAGLGSALVTTEHGYKTLIIEGSQPGGALNVYTAVGNWPGIAFDTGEKIIKRFSKQVDRFPPDRIHDTVVSCQLQEHPFILKTAAGKHIQAQALIIATGTHERKLTLEKAPPHSMKNIWHNDAIHRDFKTFEKRMKHKNVLVVGSGEDAMIKSVYAARSHAKQIDIALRGEKMKIPSWRTTFLQKLPQVQVLPHHELSHLSTDCDIAHVGFKTPQGLIQKEYDEIIISIGREPRSELFYQQLEMNKDGYILTKSHSQKTSVEGVFAAGDITLSAKYGQGAIAAADGMKAGYEVCEFLLTLFQPLEASMAGSEDRSAFYSPAL